MYNNRFNPMFQPPNMTYHNNWYIEENRGNKHHKKKNSFKDIKKNAFNSLNEVENFLCNFSLFSRYVKIYKLLKK